MPASKSLKFHGQVYRLAQHGLDVSVLKPADYQLCRFVTDHLGGHDSRMLRDCAEVVDQFQELGYSNPSDHNQQAAFFDEVLTSGWLTGQAPQQYAAGTKKAEHQMDVMTPDQLEQYLLTLWPAPSKQARARYTARESVPRRIKVKGQVYRKAETLADQLLALAVEIQDYAIPDLDKWTDLTNRMLASMEQGKNEIEVAGKTFTAQQLYDTLVRIFKQTQAQHQQLWLEKEKSRKKRLDQLPSSSRKLPEFYRDPEMMKPVLESKPVVIKPFAAAKELVYRGAVYRLGAPSLNLVPGGPATGDPEVDKAHMAAQRGLDESQAALQNFHYEWRSGMAMFQRLSAQLQKLQADVASQDAAVKQAKQDYHATKEDIAYYQEVLERLGRLDPQDRAWLREHSWLS